MSVEFRPGHVDEGDGADLLAAFAIEMDALYDGLDLAAPGMPTAGPRELGPPHGAFLVGYSRDVPVCCGGVKQLPDGACELKRLYVVPASRRQGVARELVRALEDTARALGYRVARMDTGPRQPHASRFFEAEGYAPTGNFNGNPAANWWGEKQLA
jgi:GNAT superfamily N-acetyltransferase